MRKVLVAVDGSAHAERAVRQLLAWMAEGNLPADGREIHLLNVQPLLPERLAHGMTAEALETHYLGHALTDMAVALRLLGEAGVDYHQHLERGAPAERILACAAAQGCELIIMGSHGAGFVRDVLLGSVASGVLRDAVVPVLLVR